MTRIQGWAFRHAGWTVVLATGAAILCSAQAQAALAPITFRWSPQPGESIPPALEIAGAAVGGLLPQLGNWSAGQWQELLSVYADQGDIVADVSLPPMLGEYGVQGAAIRFAPRFAWVPGIQYRAVFRPDRLPQSSAEKRESISSLFRIPPRPPGQATTVRQLHPSGGLVPENLLKFYVHFSAPMSRGQIYQRVHLLNEAGREVELPFLEIDEELWDPAMTRLTLIIDPGRIKRGVRPLEEIGPALENGKHFTLIIDREWPDSTGQPLQETFRKTFLVGPPTRDPLDPAEWKLQPPSAATRTALVVTCPRPLDYALAQRMIQVATVDGLILSGTVALDDHEHRWTFTPDVPWRPGKYDLVIDTAIEDLAGNNIGKSFDVDLFEKVEREFIRTMVKLPFHVR